MLGQPLLEKLELGNRTILFGLRGSGKTHFVKRYCEKHNIEFYPVTDFKVDTIRDITSHNLIRPRMYCFENIENMSIQAQNILLKTIEESKEHYYFALTARHQAGVLATIMSRCSPYWMSFYQNLTLEVFAKEIGYMGNALHLCKTPGDVIYVQEHEEEMSKALELIELIYDKLEEVSISNSLKITDRLLNISNCPIFVDLVLEGLTQKFRYKFNKQRGIVEHRLRLERGKHDQRRTLESLFIKLKSKHYYGEDYKGWYID